MDIFEKASQAKLRFETTKGSMSTEDLWDLSLPSLDTLAKGVNKKLKEDSEESFIGKKTPGNTVLELKLDILKRVINVKLEAADAAKLRAERNAKLAQLKELAVNKSNEALAGKSLEDINKMIAELESAS